MAEFSFQIGATELLIKRFPKPKILPVYMGEWLPSWAENMHADDQGAAQDIYESEIVFHGKESYINGVQDTLESARESVTLTNISDYIFAPNVNHAGSIVCAIKSAKPRRSLAKATGSSMWELPVTLRAIAPALVSSPAASLDTLRPQYGYEADKILQAAKGFSLDQTPTYLDRRTDAGLLRLPCLQFTSEIVPILRYVLEDARAAAVSFPSGTGITYPFGVVRGPLPKDCKIIGLDLSRRDFSTWALTLTFAEHN